MQSMQSMVGVVQNAISSGDDDTRRNALRNVTQLFIEQSEGYSELHVAVFDEVILRLARDMEFKARVELSEKLADIENAPKKVIKSLATDDDVGVATPVLQRSKRLSETDLIEIAQSKGDGHLLAISQRSELSENITDVLIDRGSQTVVRSVAGNLGARFSEGGFEKLLEKAREDTELQKTLKRRGDIPPEQMAQLVEIAREKVRETLKAELGENASAVIDETVLHVSELTTKGTHAALITDNFDDAIEVVERTASARPLREEDIANWIKEGKIEEVIAAIARMANVPVLMVSKAYHSPHYDPMLFLIRALKFTWGTFKLILQHKAGRTPPQDMMRSAFDSFQQLSVQTAQRVVRFTAARDYVTQKKAN
jgi:uncharacterized protein (DUF2336 family)